MRQLARDRRIPTTPRWSGYPRLVLSVVLRWQTHAEDATTALGFFYHPFNLRSANPVDAGEKGPLVLPGDKLIVEEDAVVLLAGFLL